MMNKYCLITGAASGLGRSFAFKFFKSGYNLILVDKDIENLEKIKTGLTKLGSNIIYSISKDLSIDGSAFEIFTELSDLNIQIEILINNAGFGIFGPFSENTVQSQSELIRLSVLTTTQLTRLFLPDMIKNESGKIMLVSSLAAFQPAPIMSVYAASKVYLLYLGEALANELKESGITVTVFCPGMIKTNFQKVTGNKKPQIQWNILTPEKAAELGYKSIMKGSTVAIPGFMSKILSLLHRVFTRKFAASMVRNIHESNRAV